MKIFAIDPGTEQSGWVVMIDGAIIDSGVWSNEELLKRVAILPWDYVLAIEMIASYGMAVGKEVFATCVWIGRYMQASRNPDAVRLVFRKDVKLHLCGSPRAKDPNIRQALIDLYEPTGGGKTPQIGTKAKPGPLFGVSTHAWPALGVAVTVQAMGAQ